ncbi:hypothetical protein TIFTF001_033392 [Ficus carica]|uniref:Uncharacterized protein n=1 Tax=Ficus carica TaxID=3494 RepID=A0AA88J7K2_FICCA|nr:hypothetical protein TIFTF001_033392 [Ficus carica]
MVGVGFQNGSQSRVSGQGSGSSFNTGVRVGSGCVSCQRSRSRFEKGVEDRGRVGFWIRCRVSKQGSGLGFGTGVGVEFQDGSLGRVSRSGQIRSGFGTGVKVEFWVASSTLTSHPETRPNPDTRIETRP